MNTAQLLGLTVAVPAAILTALWGWRAGVAFAIGVIYIVLVAFADEALR